MKTVQSKDGTVLAYDMFGSGPALIFITGATCFRTFEPVIHDAQIFAQAFTVYNYDRRGRGDSGNTLPYRIEREIEDIEAMIDTAGGAAYLYGHSSGAILALEAAMELGDKVKKLVIYDPPYVHDETYQKEFKELSDKLSMLLDSGKKEEAILLFLTDPTGVGIPGEVVTGMQQLPHWKTMVALAPTLVYDTAIASRYAPIKQVSQFTTPTHIIVGEHSPTSMHEIAAQLSEGMPHAKYSKLTGQDHLVDPEQILESLTSFLKQ
ncbi:alpha/beta hydrolase [Bacillus horti]